MRRIRDCSLFLSSDMVVARWLVAVLEETPVRDSEYAMDSRLM